MVLLVVVLGLWFMTCFHITGMKLGFMPAFSNSAFTSFASKIDFNDIVDRWSLLRASLQIPNFSLRFFSDSFRFGLQNQRSR